ncbi:MAG: response regulator [Caldilinea sp.]|nr:response regulator [Caldilinea sp.]MDW8441120.1 response regulator [Caldilineaceae bacterium]
MKQPSQYPTMPEKNALQGEQTDGADTFIQMVRTALLHLYDNAYLQNHSLTALWAGDSPGDRLTHAQDLRRTLLDCIERLRPQSAAHGDAARVYAVLTYRCVDGLTIEEIEHKLGLSRRQVYREFGKGVEAVTTQLQDLLRTRGVRSQQQAAADAEAEAAPSRRELAEAELVRLRKEMRSESLDLRRLLEGLCALLNARLQPRGLQFDRSELHPTPPVLADRALLRQALLNLLSYAIDVLPPNTALQLSTHEIEGAVRLRLRQQTLHRTLETRFLEPTPPPQRREGVALTVAESLITALNGRLMLRETPDAWTAEITLPTAQAPTVLIIDDNQGLIELFQRYLAGHRVVVVGATGGEEALQLLQQVTPQAILLDVMMPHQDGWEVLQRLRKEAAPTTPILVCSVLREHELALSLGANDALVKPVSQPALLDALRRWLGTLHPLA